ncbi:MAG: N-acetyltransferase [Elusimicrobia bacterium]|nr:N-acetyltransferase [Elusimicrobiota bacterium]MBD3411835.1 N-acetyltransferase [Elusimicrobiota bacterium]
MPRKRCTLRKARVEDVKQIHALINGYAKKNLMLPRALNDIYDDLQSYFVAESAQKIIGCSALKITWEDLAEIRSLAVASEFTRKKIGIKLVQRCIREAKSLGIQKVFALTFVPEYFRKMGFKDISREELPHKVWGDCIRCPLFPDCGEVPLIKEVA